MKPSAKPVAGAVEYMPIVPVGNSTQLLKKLKKRGFWIIGADMDGTVDYFHSSLTEPIVLVIGSEGRGMSHGWSKKRVTCWCRSLCSAMSILSMRLWRRLCSYTKQYGSGRR
jgi:tRNA G18 (ribose-2'-O)-methylase SpoU